MTKTQIICDACGKPIDPAGPFIQLKPLRGGLSIHRVTPEGTGTKRVAEELTLCNGNCVNALIAKIDVQAAKPSAPSAAK